MTPKINPIIRWTFLILLLLWVAACNRNDEALTGTVHTIDVENKRILVISQLKEEDLNKDYKVVLESNAYSQATWVNNIAPSNYKKGDEIKVFFEGRDDSYPAQVTAKRIVRGK